MYDRKLVVCLLSLSVALAVAACTTPRAEPFEVTYYYLPG